MGRVRARFRQCLSKGLGKHSGNGLDEGLAGYDKGFSHKLGRAWVKIGQDIVQVQVQVQVRIG